VNALKPWAYFGLAALAFTACSNGASAPPTVANTLAPSTEQTSAPTISVAVTTPAPTTTIEPTTLPATTTTVATEDLIKTAVQDYFEAYEQCGMAPAACDPEAFTATQGPSRAILKDFAAGLIANGLYFSTDRRGMYLVAESVNVTSDSEANAIYCVYDAGIVMGPTGPDGAPTVINDVIASVRYSYDLFFESGAWSVGRQQQVERLGEGSLCPPSE
jgi:hypothetical protein